MTKEEIEKMARSMARDRNLAMAVLLLSPIENYVKEIAYKEGWNPKNIKGINILIREMVNYYRGKNSWIFQFDENSTPQEAIESFTKEVESFIKENDKHITDVVPLNCGDFTFFIPKKFIKKNTKTKND